MVENKRYIAFTVPGKPVGKQRPRFSRRGTAVRTYTPRQTAEYERLVKESYIAAGGEKLEGTIGATICGYFEPPKATSKKQRQKMLSGEVGYTKKVDADNLAKSVLDALNGIAYDDDAQVSLLLVYKAYAETARVEVQLKEL